MPEPVTFACVLFQGEDVPEHSLGVFTPEWADRLYRGIKRNCTRPFRFVCYCDRDYEFSEPVEARPLVSEHRNMFSLLEVFREDLGRVVFMGLDTVIVGSVDHLADYDGPFAMLPDPWLDRPCSGVMMFPHTPEVWDAFMADDGVHKIGQHHSDMIFLATVPHVLMDDTGIYSYKAHCREGVPDDACIVYFHGLEKPHELRAPWLEEHWGPPIAAPVQFVEGLNTPPEVMLAQALENSTRGLPWVAEQPARSEPLAVVGGGPSLGSTLMDLFAFEGDVVALNGAHDYLIARGLVPTYQAVLDSREVNVGLVANPHRDVRYLIGAQVHPGVLDALEGHTVALWGTEMRGMENIGAPFLLSGGATVGLKMLYLGYQMGYREFHLFGMDSSYLDGRHHAYEQGWNGSDSMTVSAAGVEYVCEPWMAKQAIEFQEHARLLWSLGCIVEVHGTGLLPRVAQLMNASEVQNEAEAEEDIGKNLWAQAEAGVTH